MFGDRVDSVAFSGTEGNDLEGGIRLFWTVKHPAFVEPFEVHVPYIADKQMCRLMPLRRNFIQQC